MRRPQTLGGPISVVFLSENALVEVSHVINMNSFVVVERILVVSRAFMSSFDCSMPSRVIELMICSFGNDLVSDLDEEIVQVDVAT